MGATTRNLSFFISVEAISPPKYELSLVVTENGRSHEGNMGGLPGFVKP